MPRPLTRQTDRQANRLTDTEPRTLTLSLAVGDQRSALRGYGILLIKSHLTETDVSAMRNMASCRRFDYALTLRY